MGLTNTILYKNKFFLLLFFVFSFSSFLQAQTTIPLVRFNNVATYTAGSGVSVIINPTDVFTLSNRFVLELSDAGGTWNSPTVLNTLSEFYTPVINGVLPTSLAGGTYKLRVRSTDPVVITQTDPFLVSADPSIGAIPSTSSTLTSNSNFFNCMDCSGSNYTFGSLTRSATATVGNNTLGISSEGNRMLTICGYESSYNYNVKLIDVLKGTTVDIVRTDAKFSIPTTLGIGTYVFEIEKTNGTVSTVSSVVFLFHGNGTSLSNSTNENVCVGQDVTFTVQTNDDGIGRNYYGSVYKITYGDGTPPLELTHAQLMSHPILTHKYETVSCSGEKSTFLIEETLYNKGISFTSGKANEDYCNKYYQNGGGVKKDINSSKAPVAGFDLPGIQCATASIKAVNKTVIEGYGNNSCLSTPVYYWSYKKPGDTSFTPVTDNTWINATTNDLTIPVSVIGNSFGCWDIKLEAQNADLCQEMTEKTHTIKVEATPVPTFTMSSASPICANTSIKFTNTTNVIGLACQDPTYTWEFGPEIGTPATFEGIVYINGTNANTLDPEVKFTQPGTYWVKLSVTNSCGPFVSALTTITVNGDPTVTADVDNMTECTANISGSANYTLDLATALIKPTYSLAPYAPASYAWTVGGTGVTSADYSYVGGTTASSPFPKIKFTSFKTYELKVKVNGNCAVDKEKVLTLILNEIPEITNPTADLSQAICSGTATTALNLTSSLPGTTFNWTIASTMGTTTLAPISGSGTTIPATVFDNVSSTNGTVRCTITPTKNGCSGVTKELVVTVYPKLEVHPFVPIVLCNNTSFKAAPFVSDVSAATFSWTNDNTAIGLAASGTGDLPTFTSVNAGTTPIVAHVTVTPQNEICAGEPFTFEIFVNPTPTVADVPSFVKCAGDQSGAISFTGTVPGTIYKWINDNSTIGIPANGDGDISSIALVNNTNTVQVANITVTPTFTNPNLVSSNPTCSGTPKTFKITVNPTAAVVQPDNQSICNGGSTSDIFFTTLNTGGATTYNWTNNDPSIGLGASGSGDIPGFAVINAGNAPKTATVTVTPTFTTGEVSCSGVPKKFFITANPTPSVQSLSNQAFCDGVGVGAIVFETPVAGTVCTWTNSNTAIGLAAGGTGNIPVFVATNPTANPITATIEVTPTAYGCTGTKRIFTITINPTIKTVLSSPAQTICSGDNSAAVTLSSASTVVSYDWQMLPSLGVEVPITSGSTNTIPAQTLVNTTALPVNVVFEATATLTDGTGCVGPKSYHTITVNPKATIATINSSICSGGMFSVTPADGGGNIIPNGTQYIWSTPTISSPGAISGGVDQPVAQSVIGGTLTNSTSAIATATYSVTPISGTCIGSPFDVVVTVNPTPTVNSVSDEVYCAGEASTQIDFAGDVSGSTFDWTCDNTSIGLVSSGTDKVLSFTTTNSTNSPIVATITVTPKANGCVGTAKTFTITVNPRPVITTSLGDIIICNNTLVSSSPLLANVAGTSFDWTNDAPVIGLAANGSGNLPDFTAVNTGTLPIIATINVTPKANGCEGTPKSFTITVNPTPTVDAVASQELCSGFMTNAVNFTGNIGTTTYNWTNTNSSIGLASGGFGNIPAFTAINNGSTPVTATITVTPTVNGCSGVPVIFNIVINPTPAFTAQPVSNSICKDGVLPALSVSFINGTGTASYQWFSNVDNNTVTGTPIPSTNSPTYTPSSSTVGTLYYYCKVTFSTGGCANLTSTPAAITINALPTMSLEPLATQSLCVGGTIPTPLTVGYRDGVGVDSYQWYSNTSNDTNSGTAISGANASAYTPPVFTVPGKYYYYAVITLDGIGCGSTKSAVAEVNVVPDPIVTLQPIASQTLCQNSPAAILEVKASGGIGDYAYQWYRNATSTGTGTSINGATDATYTPSTATVGTVYYYCVITQPNGVACSVTSDFAEVKVNLVPSIVTQPQSSTICRGEVPTQLSVVCANGVGTPQYQWYSNTTNDLSGSIISGETNATFNPPYAAAGTVYYYCIVTYPTGGCSVLTSNIANVTIHQYPVISPFTTRLIGSGTSFSVNPIDNGTDIVPVGTTYSWSAPVVVPANAIMGATAQVGQTGISQLLNNVTRSTATATYTVTPQNGGCPGADFKVEVEVRPLLISNAVPKNISCFGEVDGSITTNIEGGIPPYTVLWTGPNGFTSAATSISGLAQGEYTLKITDSGNSLPFIKTYTVIEPGEITLTTDVNKNVSCFGAANGEIAISVTGGTGAYTYAWTKNNVAYATTEDIANLNPGDYVVTVSDVNNCGPKILSFTITEPKPLKIDLISKTDVLCFGDSTGAISVSVQGGTKIEFTPGVFDYKYAWTGPKGFTSTSQNLEHLFAGTYYLKVTDKQGCELTFSVTVTQQSEIIIKATTSPITCYGANNATIQLDVSGGVPPYQTLWNNLASGESLDNLAAGDYVVTVIDALSCSRSLDVTIPEAPIFKITPVVKQISCFGAHDGSITLNYLGDSKLSKLVWSDGSTSGTTRNNLGPGTYTVEINDGSPCRINKTFVIVEPQPIVLSAVVTHALSCDNANSGAIDLTVSGGTPPYTYSWSSGAKTADLTNITSGNYLVTVTDANACVQTAQYIVTRPAPLAIAINTVADFDCTTQIVSKISTAKVTGGVPPYTLTWSSGKISGANNEIMQTTQNSLVIIDVVDALGCTGNYTFKVDIPTLGIDYQLVDCNTRSCLFNALVPLDKETYTFAWDFGDGTNSSIKNPMHTFTTPGNYTVKLKFESATCKSAYSVVVTVEANPKVAIDKAPIMCQGDSMVLRASGAYTYRWSEGSLVDTMLIKRAGDYTVIGYSKAGCTDTLNFKVTYYDSYNYTIQTDKVETSSDESPIHIWTEDIPFSQYYWDFGDGKTAEGADQSHTYDRNQVGHFDIKLKVMNPNGCVENATKRVWVLNKSTVNTFSPNNDGINDVFMKGWHLQIFNRNGVFLYEGNDGWDGKYNGQTVKNDTYFYVLFYESETGTKTRTGYITVMW